MRAITDYLGHQASVMMSEEPFMDWAVERSVEEDLDPPFVHYVFPKRGLELRCGVDERVSVIFLRSDVDDAFDDNLVVPAFSFSWSRDQVLEHLGTPSKSGAKRSHPILGDYGAWDRFTRLDYVAHVEYRLDADVISKITLMRDDVVP
jgi:hypothetical protein